MQYTTKEELLALIEDSAVENQILEFKAYSFADGKIGSKEKDDLAKEIVALANSEGGHIIIGIDEDGNRMATKLNDICCSMSQFDGIQLSIQQYMLAKVRPRLYGVAMYGIDIDDGKITITISVPKSYSRPHALNDGNKDNFYIRHSNGITHMSVDDLRRQFLSTASYKKDIQIFRQDRIGMILSNEVFGSSLDGAKVLLHIVPLWSLEEGNNIDIGKIAGSKTNETRPISGSGYRGAYNSDGWVAVNSNYQTNEINSYVQFFRNGIIEAAEIRMMNYQEKIIYQWEVIESAVYKAAFRYAEILKDLAVPKPWHIYISFIGAKGFRSSGDYYDDGAIERDIVHATECVWDDDDICLDKALRPAFDSLANALGRAQSANYDRDGNFIQRT